MINIITSDKLRILPMGQETMGLEPQYVYYYKSSYLLNRIKSKRIKKIEKICMKNG